MNAEHSIPMSTVMRQMTLSIRITGAKTAAARMWLGAQIMKLAALVIGCQIEITTD